MTIKPASDRLSTRSHRLVFLIGYLLILIVGLRRRYDLVEPFSIQLLISTLGLFTLLFTSETFLSRKVKSYTRIYFAIQFVLVQFLGLFREYQDVWAWLYVVLGFQVTTRCSRKEALFWFGLFMASLVVTLSLEFGLLSGLGRAMAYIAMGMVMISYDIQYAQHEDALAESQVLLAELKEAHQKLQAHAAQAQELAALQQRESMVKQLYDSVGQRLFAIQLAVETTRMLLVKDPRRVAEQVSDLQQQTQSTLDQMRQLIGQWRPD